MSISLASGTAAREHMERLLQDNGQLRAYHLSYLRGQLAKLATRRPMIVVDRAALAASGITAELQEQCAEFACTWFDDFAPNPTSVHVMGAVEALRGHAADCIVAVGGGSCLDVAKVAALAACANSEAKRVACGETAIAVRALPIVAVPTTSGTGSEATHFAAIYVDGRKVSVAHPGLRPMQVILDSRLHLAMPPDVAATTGLDALCQALESFWAVGATSASLEYAREAARLIAASLIRSVLSGAPDAREAMMLGAHLGGQAINLGKTTAAHAMSYAVTQGYGVPHGHAVALMLGAVARYNHDVDADSIQHPGGADLVRARIEAAAGVLDSTPDKLSATIAGLLRTMRLAPSLRDAGIPEAALARLAAQADPVRLGNNPRKLSLADAQQVFRRAWQAPS